MHIIAGTIWEAPQETHLWNNDRLTPEEVESINQYLLVSSNGDSSARMRRFLWIIPLFHLPIFGGWRRYRVLTPTDYGTVWYVGWIPEDAPAGYSRIPIIGYVRVLEGHGPCKWFAVDKYGNQIPLQRVGFGRVGEGGPYAHTPLR
ncbi:MAG: hypothetical protein KBD24_01355 [Candidatus Pacebacteria bacterium]|nr:hypothetical protein [Candidatus Paceibacterota bacterium]